MSMLRRLASRFDDWLDRRRMEKRRTTGQDERVIVVPYPGWATEDFLWLRGSVVEQDKVENPAPAATIWEDLSVTLGRFMAEEIMGATVSVTVGELVTTVKTDSDGFFNVQIPVRGILPHGWSSVTVRLEDFPGMTQAPLEVSAPVLRPHAEAGFGVISDIDDTILRTGIAEPLKNIRTIIEADAEARVAFPGLPELYRGLQSTGGINPIFYVSSGSWKLFDLIAKFKELNGIPKGPVFMDDWGIDETRWFKSSHGAHKTATIDRILATYPALDFILVGDSGQHDAEIYAEAVRTHGTRIKAVWIRDVSGNERDAEVAALLRDAEAAGVAVFAEPDLQQAAVDAAEQGWITANDFAAVQGAIAGAQHG